MSVKIPEIASLMEENGHSSWWFQQDDDSKHTAKVVQDWLETNVSHFTKKNQWSANSSDLNLIENLWAYMDRKVHARRARTLEGLKKIIKDEWAKITANKNPNIPPSPNPNSASPKVKIL